MMARLSNYVSVTAGQYLSLDTDHNGMLNKAELSRYEEEFIILLTGRVVPRVHNRILSYSALSDHMHASQVT